MMAEQPQNSPKTSRFVRVLLVCSLALNLAAILAAVLAAMALQLDYRVTICDPRESFADPSPLPEVTYSRLPPDEAVLAGDPRRPAELVAAERHAGEGRVVQTDRAVHDLTQPGVAAQRQRPRTRASASSKPPAR